MIDSHCHLADEAFAGDLDDVVARARDAGLERALVILEAGNEKEAAQAQRVGALWPETRVSVGVHPHQAHQFSADPSRAAAAVREQIAATPAADDDTLTILREEGGGALRGVLHCFTGGPALAEAGLALGFYISLAGII